MSSSTFNRFASMLCAIVSATACSAASNPLADVPRDAGVVPADQDGGASNAATPDARTSSPTKSCAPDDMSSFTPKWVPPSPTKQGVCDASQISKLAACLFDPSANLADCDKFLTANENGTCVSCAITQEPAPSVYGPMVVREGSLLELNLSGCIAHATSNVSAAGCGAKLQAQRECTNTACAANCPVPKDDSKALNARRECFAEADNDACASHNDAATRCLEGDLPDAATVCLEGTFEERAKAYVALFCGK